MNKHEKFFKKLSASDRERIAIAVSLIHSNNYQTLDVKKLSSFEVYRVRVGKFRIKFIKHETFNEILEISRRSDTTYNF